MIKEMKISVREIDMKHGFYYQIVKIRRVMETDKT